MTTSYQLPVNNYQLSMPYQFAVTYEASLLTLNHQPTVKAKPSIANRPTSGGHHG